MSCWVVKVGGALCETPQGLEKVARACMHIPGPYVLVHGGGVMLSRMQKALGYETVFKEGKRFTSEKDMSLVQMVLSGEANGHWVRALVQQGVKAVGLSGYDAGMVRCEPVPSLGCVGVPSQVDVGVLQMLLSQGYTPVVSPVSLANNGMFLNVNADDVACALAIALKAQRLLLVSDVQGVRLENQVAEQLDVVYAETCIQKGWITGGMIPKIRAAQSVVRAGVQEVFVCSMEEGFIHPQGTRIVRGDTEVSNVA
jgi:acetylglutamate kinase